MESEKKIKSGPEKRKFSFLLLLKYLTLQTLVFFSFFSSAIYSIIE